MRMTFLCLLAMGLLALISATSFGAPTAPRPEPTGSVAAAKDPGAIGGAPAEPVSIERIIRELKRQYWAGGSTMHFILALSILGVAFVLERLFRLRRRNIAPPGLAAQADALYRQGRYADVEALALRHQRSTLGKIILFIVRHRGNTVEQYNAVASDISSRDIARHLMFTYPLATVAVIAPLLGLFGTVVGMIESFELVTAAGQMGDPAMLSGSISKALITTAFGLIVAMPILFCYHMIKLRTQFLANQLDSEASGLIYDWCLKATPAAPAIDGQPAKQEVLQ